jgi:hypothetical protein
MNAAAVRRVLLTLVAGLLTPGAAIGANDKLGPPGPISLQQAIPYSIRFENAATATAPVQQLVIVDPLDLATLDPSTVSLGPISFGDIRIDPLGLPSFTTQVDLRPGRNLLVNVSAGFDPVAHTLSWYFTSIDPNTGQPPTDPLAGFLPPNVTPPGGEGSVLFTIRPRASLTDGTIIHNAATIAFDGSPITTNTWSVTVDATPPSSHVLPLPARTDAASITVSWTADGAPSDLRDFTIHVSEDGGPARVWRLNTTATSDTLIPPGEHRPHAYAFYSVARDVSGNVEPPPSTPDASTQSLLAVEPGVAPRLALGPPRPNPSSQAIRVVLMLSSRKRASLDLVDVAGRTWWHRDVGVLGPGAHAVEIDPRLPPRSGLYFVRLTQGGETVFVRASILR